MYSPRFSADYANKALVQLLNAKLTIVRPFFIHCVHFSVDYHVLLEKNECLWEMNQKMKIGH